MRIMNKTNNIIPWHIKGILSKGLKTIIPLTLLFVTGAYSMDVKSFYESNVMARAEVVSLTAKYIIGSQDFIVSGTISDTNGNVLPGASIVEKGTRNGVQSDFDGNFTISLANPQSIIVVSYIGYASKEIKIGGQDQVTIVMEESAAGLDEVVVVGYGTQRKSDLTGAIVNVTAEDFTEGANYDAVQLLSGAASGVNVSQVSSAPGAPLKIQIRGAGSINSSNDVLFVVDGLPGVDPSSLSPGDIESIDVLKDASSSAIYGTRAANGVVLITTKKGKAGKTSISYNTYTGFQSSTKKLDVLGASDYMEMTNFRQINNGGSAVYSDSEINSAGKGTNWQDELFTNALVQNHDLSVSGGDAKGNYYLGLNYFDQDGIVKTSSNQKYNIRLNIQSRPFDNLLISANANFTRNSTKSIIFDKNQVNEGAGPINSAIQFDPTLPAGIGEDGTYYRNPSIALDNPVALINGIDDRELVSQFYASVNADYEPIENVTATLRVGADVRNGRSDHYRNRMTLAGLANGGIASVGNSESSHWLLETLLRYENTFNEVHDVSIMGGVTFEEFLNRNMGGFVTGFLTDVTGTNSLQSGDGDLGDGLSSGKFKNQLNGFIGRGTYGFNNKYLMTLSFRVDGSSRFTKNNKYAFFPSGSLGWRISEEAFLKESNFINELKVRAGYGQLGNQGINNFETRQTLVAGGNSVFGGAIAQGVELARLPNPDLKWETTTEVNLGLDFELASSKLSGSIDMYNRITQDQLFIKPLPSVVGFSTVRTNFGEVENKGIDINLRANFAETNNFDWSSNLNFSFLKNEVKELPDFTEEIITGSIGYFINQYNIIREGVPLRSFYGYEVNGMFQLGDDIANSPTPAVSGYTYGMPKFVDQNNDGLIDTDDRVVLGDPFPDFTFGFNNSFRYKNISLDVFLMGVQGIETLDGNITESLYPTNSYRNSISRYYKERWTPENPTNSIPSGVNPTLYGGGRAINSMTVMDASYVRLKNITLGYNVPLTGNSLLQSLRFFVAADNLLTITDYDGYDPDSSADGTSVAKTNYNSYPLAKTIRLGLDVKF